MTSPLTRLVARLLLLPTFVVATALLAKGYAGPGDGFSAGVVVAVGVLLQYVAFGRRRCARVLPVRRAPAAAVVGLLLALLVGLAPPLWGRPIVSHLPAPGQDAVHLGVLEMHTAALLDLGVFLVVLGFAVGAIDAVAREER